MAESENNHRNIIKFSDIPSDRFKARQHLFESSITSVIDQTVLYIHSGYPKRELLDEAMWFVFQDLFDCPKPDIDSLSRCGLFPWIESQYEIDSGINLLLFGYYKNVYDSLRRALELILVGAYFTAECTNSQVASAWMESESGTPFFSKMLSELPKSPIFDRLQKELDFQQLFKNKYWALCDVVHTKGVKYSNREMNKGNTCINGIMLTRFDQEVCSKTLDMMLEVIGLKAIVVSASNPSLLVGFDIEQKFGINGPITGFFRPSQTERMLSLMPSEYKKLFEDIAENDKSVQCIREWAESLPDITEEEFKEQCRQQDSWIERMNGENK